MYITSNNYIQNTANKNIYIGSTIVKLNQRLREHKCDYNRYLKDKYNYVEWDYLEFLNRKFFILNKRLFY